MGKASWVQKLDFCIIGRRWWSDRCTDAVMRASSQVPKGTEEEVAAILYTVHYTFSHHFIILLLSYSNHVRSMEGMHLGGYTRSMHMRHTAAEAADRGVRYAATAIETFLLPDAISPAWHRFGGPVRCPRRVLAERRHNHVADGRHECTAVVIYVDYQFLAGRNHNP